MECATVLSSHLSGAQSLLGNSSLRFHSCPKDAYDAQRIRLLARLDGLRVGVCSIGEITNRDWEGMPEQVR